MRKNEDMDAEKMTLTEKISRLVCSAPNITLGEMEHQKENEIPPFKKRNEHQSHHNIMKLSSTLNESLKSKLDIKSMAYQTIERDLAKPNLTYYSKLLLAATVVLFLGLFTGFYLKSLLFPQNIRPYDDQPKLRNRDVHREILKEVHVSGTTLLNKSLHPVEIHAKSYIEYQANMYAIKDYQPVSVFIELASPEDWPRQAQLARAEQVTILKIRGNYSLSLFTFILSSLQNLESLTVISNETELDHSANMLNFTNSDSANVSLIRLRHLVFVNFTKSSHVLSMFSSSPNIIGIRQLKMENGVVNKVNVELIRTLINNNRYSLRKLSFPDTRWVTPLLTEHFPILSNLTSLRMDFITLNGTSLGYVSTMLAIKLPNLTSFISIKGFAPWNDFRKTLNIKTLETLRCGIEIPRERKEFRLNFLENEFPSLKKAYLSLNFLGSNETLSSCRIYGIDSLRPSFKVLEIQTTCEIHVNGRHGYM